jgi:putative ATP-dependent endonuclease of the OLD family
MLRARIMEPHRIRRLLHSLGAKEKAPPLQGFLTTHSPVVLREISAEQLMLLRRRDDKHTALPVGSKPDVQGTLRRFPEAFLAASVLVCESASEVGLVRGLDQYNTAIGEISLSALGVELVDAGGCDHIYSRANAFRSLGYRVTVLRDDDKKPDAAVEAAFIEGAGPIHKWRDGWALEDELFDALPDKAVTALLNYAIQLHGNDLVGDHIKSTSNGKVDLPGCQGKITPAVRAVLAKACARDGNPFPAAPGKFTVAIFLDEQPPGTAASSSAVRTRTPDRLAHVSQETLLEARCPSG